VDRSILHAQAERSLGRVVPDKGSTPAFEERIEMGGRP
jgi:hypothetical protein